MVTLLTSILTSQKDLKKIQNSHSDNYSGITKQRKHLQLVSQAAEFQFESKFKPLLVIWQSLAFPKAIPDSRRQSKALTAKSMEGPWGSALAQLWVVGRTKTNTGYFQRGSQVGILVAATACICRCRRQPPGCQPQQHAERQRGACCLGRWGREQRSCGRWKWAWRWRLQ